LTGELKETKILQKTYEKKCGELIININELQIEYQKTSKKLIGNDDLAREREERIEKFRNESYDLKILWENLDN